MDDYNLGARNIPVNDEVIFAYQDWRIGVGDPQKFWSITEDRNLWKSLHCFRYYLDKANDR